MLSNASSDSTASPTWASGRFEVRRLLGKTAATMVWLVFDRRSEAELMLTMPRRAPVGPVALAEWLERARRIARLDHANVAPVVEVGVHEQWPFIAIARGDGVTLREWFSEHPTPPPAEAAAWLCDALRGLAFAHDAGIAHGDVQLHHLLVNRRGGVRMMAFGVAVAAPTVPRDLASRGMAMDTTALREQRLAAERDVLCCGVLLHHLLAGEAPLGIEDAARAIEQIAPRGREVMRLATATPLPVTDARSSIARPRMSRPAFAGANLAGRAGGWITANGREASGPIALMFSRCRVRTPAGPARTGVEVGKIISLESRRTEISGRSCPIWRSVSSCCGGSARTGAGRSPAAGRY
jgi:non-specific serine/threonine protein kinase